MKRLKRMLANRLATVCETPVIVLGNQKSGTSAIAHLLADAAGLSKTVDIPPLWPPTFNDIMQGRTTLAEVIRGNKSYFSTRLIKEPNLTFMVDQVMTNFPRATYVFIVRDPRDNIRSLLNRRKVPGDLPQAHADMIVPLPGRPRVTIAADIWGSLDDHYIVTLAKRWCKAVENYQLFHDQMRLVRYEDFCGDKAVYIQALAHELGLEARHDISGRVDVQYQPAGDRSVSYEAFFGDNLRYIETICGDYMAEFGYKLRK